MQQNLLNTKEAAQILGVSEAFLERDRWVGALIPFLKVGARAVRYHPETLQQYIESCIRRSTSDKGGSHV